MSRYFSPVILAAALFFGAILIAYELIYLRMNASDAGFIYSLFALLIIGSGVIVSWVHKKNEQLQQKNEQLQASQPHSKQSNIEKETSQQELPRVCDLDHKNQLPSLDPEQLYIIQRLFQDNYRVHVKPLQGGYTNSGVFSVIEEPNQGNIQNDRIYVAKLLEIQEIRQEIRIHDRGGLLDQYPLSFTPGDLIKSWPAKDALRIDAGNTHGAVSYHLATLERGSQLRTLIEFYHQNSFENIEPYLKRLFDERLLPWYRQRRYIRRDIKPLGGVNGEFERLYRNRERIQEHISDLLHIFSQRPNSDEHIDLTFLPDPWRNLHFHNPIHWIRNVLVPNQAECFRSEVWYSPVHGDLHAGNVLIEIGRDTHIWLIDFPNAHIGPTVVDFASMEASIKFKLLDENHCSLEEWLEFEEKLLAPLKQSRQITLVAPWYGNWQPKNEHLYKAWQFIGFLRERIVNSGLIGVDVKAYYLALLHATLPIVYRQHTPFQKRCSLTSSAWMCEYLT